MTRTTIKSLAATVVALISLSGAAGAASAQTILDRVRTADGTESGKVTAMTPQSVTLDKASAGIQEIPVNEILTILFDDEPPELTQARINARNGGYATALEALKKIELGRIDREFIAQDVQFYRTLCEAQLALGGTGTIQEAGRGLNGFVRRHPDNYHFFEAVEVMGNLLMAGKQWQSAQEQFTKLDTAPWPDYRLRAAVLVGRTLQAQGQYPAAIAEFDKVLAAPGDDAVVKQQKLAATLGKAESIAATGEVDEAVKMIEQVVLNADPEQKELHARAYNALGRSYEEAGKPKDALLAYLHVDVLYNTVPDAHAEALSHLVKLWQDVGQGERSREARETLETKYAGSPWAK